MTDIGPTGIQVAPAVPTEDEMSHVQDILKRAINSLVGMSQLQADVDMLRTTVQNLQADTERLRQQNAGLDEALYQSRQARQALETDLSNARHELRGTTQERDALKTSNENWQKEVNHLTDDLHMAQQSRDTAQLQVMELEDQLKALQAKLDAIREGYRSIFGEEPKAVQATPEPPHPEQVPDPALPTRRYLSEWAHGATWDDEKHAYYVEA